MYPTDPKLLLAAPPPVPETEPDTTDGEAPPDPSKLRSLPDFDIYLFNMGEHRRVHRLLGAHLVDGGVRAVLIAPAGGDHPDTEVQVVGQAPGPRRRPE